MEELENISSNESGDAIASPEGVREKSEKQKESYKRAQAQLQKSQKDEKKAKGDNDELFRILMRCIQNPYYESMIPVMTQLLSFTVPSRFIIGLLALIYPEAAHYVFSLHGRHNDIHLLQSLHRYDEKWNFDEKHLDSTIRTWMSTWVDIFSQYLTHVENGSVLMQQKMVEVITLNYLEILEAVHTCVLFFFQSRNIVISESVSRSYAQFILLNIKKNLLKSLDIHPEKDLLTDKDITPNNLFGVE